MIPFTITPTNIANAELHAVNHGGPRSHRDNLIGALGEIKVLEWANAEGKYRGTYKFSEPKDHYDIVASDGYTIEVKTQVVKNVPNRNYQVNMSANSWHNKSDVDCWIFVMLHNSMDHGWIVGVVNQDKRCLFEFHKEGEWMDLGRENWLNMNRRQYQNDTYICKLGLLNA